MKRLKSVELFTKKVSLSEIYQQVKMEFAFCHMEPTEKGYNVKQLHAFVQCRDFLGDAMWATVNKKKVGIYGFHFDGRTESVDFDRTSLLVRFTDKEALDRVLPLLHYYERKMRWKRTKVIYLHDISKNKKHIFLIVGSKMWMKSIALITLYTLLLRLGGHIEDKVDKPATFLQRFISMDKNVSTNDYGYISAIFSSKLVDTKKVDPVMVFLKRHTYIMGKNQMLETSGASTHNIHYSSGIVSIFNNVHRIVHKYSIYKRDGFPEHMFAEKLYKALKKAEKDAARKSTVQSS